MQSQESQEEEKVYHVPAKLFGSTEANKIRIWRIEIEWLQVGLLLPAALLLWIVALLTSFLDVGGVVSQLRWTLVGGVAAVVGYFIFGEVQGRNGPGWAYLAIVYYFVNRQRHSAASRQVKVTRLAGIRVKAAVSTPAGEGQGKAAAE